ncbi:MAG: ATP-binding cassette domain-containing protein [Sphingomonadales bacterium]|nr:ATP-binding cassette domain-containing protein [Sphingomonadales bacterium]MBU3992698.1 ATP-binding cassette domain-containing protein [Alphaproteobacteria bacterium]
MLGAALFAGSLALWLGGGVASPGTAQAPWLLIALAASGGLRALAQTSAATQGQRAANAVKQGLRDRLFAALLPTGYRRGRLPGEDLRTAIDDVEVAEGYVGRFAPIRTAAAVSPMVCAALAAFASWVAAAIMLATLLPFVIGMALAGNAARVEADRQFTALSRLTGLFVDRARTLPTIVGFAAEERVTRQIAAAAREVADRTLQVLRIAFVSSAVLEFFAALSIALVAVYCGFSLLGLLPFPAPERLDLTRAFFVLALAPEFYLGMRRLAAAYHDKQQGEAAARAIAPELDRAEALLAGMAQVTARAAPLAVEQLVVRYDDGSSIGPLTANWPANGLHVITGATGSGKSSLLHALVGMAPMATGRILASRQSVPAGSLNDQIGWSGQRPFLLPGTLEDNLLLGSANRPDADWRELVERLGLAALLAARGAGLIIDPTGSGLSGGERRRIGLARAILSGRPVLLLDEPTADLDAGSAAAVAGALQEAARTRLVIVATHDPGLIGQAVSEVAIA